MRHPHRRESIHLDGFQVPTASFDVKNFLLRADGIPLPHFHRRISAAMEHERVVASKQARAIDAQLQIGAAFARLGGVPKILHGAGCIEQRPCELPMVKTRAGPCALRSAPGLWIDTVSSLTGYIVR